MINQIVNNSDNILKTISARLDDVVPSNKRVKKELSKTPPKTPKSAVKTKKGSKKVSKK